MRNMWLAGRYCRPMVTHEQRVRKNLPRNRTSNRSHNAMAQITNSHNKMTMTQHADNQTETSAQQTSYNI